jgi:hypothetical protein
MDRTGLDEMPVVIVLVVVNACLAVGFGWPLAKPLAQAAHRPRSVGWWRVLLLGIYLLECAAFSASMGTNAFGVFLAAVWGLLLGHVVRSSSAGVAGLGLKVGLYSSLPAISFLSILPMLMAGHWPILSSEAGRRFGIPAFVPWPASTLLGFFLAVSLSALILKTCLTVGVALLWVSRSKRPSP